MLCPKKKAVIPDSARGKADASSGARQIQDLDGVHGLLRGDYFISHSEALGAGARPNQASEITPLHDAQLESLNNKTQPAPCTVVSL